MPEPEYRFIWGVATAACQVEGRAESSDWQAFTTDPHITRRVGALLRIGGGGSPALEPPGQAIEHADLDILRADLDRAHLLGVNAYRFSIEWARVEPEPGDFREDILEGYYQRVVDEVKGRGMEPLLTLHHLSLPKWVLTPPSKTRWIGPLPLASARDRGFRSSLRGWESAATVDAFASFVARVVPRLRAAGVRCWITLNEPTGSVIGMGYLGGIWPPGFTLAGRRARIAYFNLLRAHVRAHDIIKAVDPDARVGVAHAMSPCRPFRENGHLGRLDAAAAAQSDYFYHQHLLDSVLTGQVDVRIDRRPKRRRLMSARAFYGLGDDAWTPRLDFVGLNYYRPLIIRAHPLFTAFAGYSGGLLTVRPEERSPIVNDGGERIDPGGLGEMIKRIHDTYGLPVLVTENGIPDRSDLLRGPYIVSHVESLRNAQAAGAQVLGYLHWTLIDNWEWHQGYHPNTRLGLYTIDRLAAGMPRALTPGSLAFRHFALGGGVGEAKERFGFISDDHLRAELPTKSGGALWSIAAEDGELAVFLSRIASGIAPTGILFEPERGHWSPIAETDWEVARVSAGRLHLVHRVGARRLDLSRQWLEGAWVAEGDAPFVSLQVSGLGRWEIRGGPPRWLAKTHDGSRWQACTDCRLEGDRLLLSSSIGATLNELSLDVDSEPVRLRASGQDWSARRLPDGVLDN